MGLVLLKTVVRKVAFVLATVLRSEESRVLGTRCWFLLDSESIRASILDLLDSRILEINSSYLEATEFILFIKIVCKEYGNGKHTRI